MPESTLITFTCAHYTITPQTLSNPMEEDLYRIPTTRHRPSRHHCIQCSNDGVSSHELRDRFASALQGIREFLTNAKCHYLHLGVRYFCKPSKACSSTPNSNFAQSQFCIEKRRWDVDPFFQPWLQLAKLVSLAEAELEAENFNDAAGGICEHINEARAVVGRIVCAMWGLVEALKEIDERERMQDFGNRIKVFSQAKKIEREEQNFGDAEREAARVQREKRAREQGHDAQRRVLRRAAFEHSLFQNWQRRVEGFERMEMEVEVEVEVEDW